MFETPLSKILVFWLGVCGVLVLVESRACAREIHPLIREYCFDCHGDGSKKGGVALDVEAVDPVKGRETWFAVWRNLDAEMMPPSDKPRPSAAERAEIQRWVEQSALNLDPEHPDPGKVVIRRLNLQEYRNSIKDLTEIDYDVAEKFPPDDTGYGFDTIGAVLNLSPIHLEKYLAAAQEILAAAFQQGKMLAGRRLNLEEPPLDVSQRREHLKEMIRPFASRAFRRPVDEATLESLTSIGAGEASLEEAVKRSFSAVLAAPRFLFRGEPVPPGSPGAKSAPVDEYALASRLSYFLWSSLPDDELLGLAAQGKLRTELRAQVKRMLLDRRSFRFAKNFVGQWLQTRDAENVPIQPRVVLNLKKGSAEEKIFSPSLREGMRRETELLFAHILKENLPAVEMLTARYSFLNEALAGYYGIPGVRGKDMQKVMLPTESHRQGILSHGSFLVVSSNPTRTSPVKRGLFVLENILGSPPPPPPPNIPPLESAGHGKHLSMRELMELHRSDPLCASCHKRMDPIGLAFEKFNAMGMYLKDPESAALDVSGQLITGEKFNDLGELVSILSTARKRDFYRCLTEKMLIYALGRGLSASDIPTINLVLEKVGLDGGGLASMILAVVESVPFQNARLDQSSSF